jgi:hypothetical protein
MVTESIKFCQYKIITDMLHKDYVNQNMMEICAYIGMKHELHRILNSMSRLHLCYPVK